MEENPYLKKDADRLIITSEGHAFLEKIVTDTRGPVYAFTNQASPLITAAAMARLSRRGSDLREILLDEFVLRGDESADGVIDRVVTGFGDDSVQQLMIVSMVVENASNILTKKIEWGRLRAYLEQSTRYIFFDSKDVNGNYRHFVPRLSAEIEHEYRSTMDRIFDVYSKMVRGMTEYVRTKTKEPSDKKERIAWLGATRAQACDVVRPILPASTMSTVGIVASSQSIEYLILHLAGERLLECRKTAKDILREARKVAAPFLKRADMPERGGAMVAYRMNTRDAMRELARIYLGNATAGSLISKPVVLLDYWPHDELDIVPEMLFGQSTLPITDIEKATKGLNKHQKEKIFHAYMGRRLNRRHKPGRAIEKIHYEWQITADYGTFRDLQRHRMVDMLEWQNLTTEYGYDVPPLVSDAGYEDDFRACFALSEKLYDTMRDARLEEEAQYATLLGHKMRYRFMINAREAFHLHELRTGPQGHPGYRKLVQEMHTELTRVHPLLGATMKFVNMGEDPELTRLAGELATQKKLELLEGEHI